MKRIEANSEVLVHFVMKLEDGSVAESTYLAGKPMVFRLGDNSLSPSLESNLLGMTEKEKKTFLLEPIDAFGEISADQIHHIERHRFDENVPIDVGNIVAFSSPQGEEIPGVITEVIGDSVTVNFNHPLAGKTITFEVDVVSVRA